MLRYRWLLFLMMVLSTLACDQLSKRAASAELQRSANRYYLGGVVELVYAENEGALLGLGQRLSATSRFWLLSAGGVLLLLLLSVVLYFRGIHSVVELAGWALLFGGGLGNLFDRLSRDGAVIDFLRLSLGPIHTAIFNIADVAILAGVVVLVFGSRGDSESSGTPGGSDSEMGSPPPTVVKEVS